MIEKNSRNRIDQTSRQAKKKNKDRQDYAEILFSFGVDQKKLTEPSSRKRNKTAKSIFFHQKSLFLYTFQTKQYQRWTRVKPTWPQDSLAGSIPRLERETSSDSPASALHLLPATINQSASLPSPRGSWEDGRSGG